MAVTPDGQRAVVGTEPLTIVDLPGREVVGTLDVAASQRLAVDSVRGYVCALGDEISVIDPGSS